MKNYVLVLGLLLSLCTLSSAVERSGRANENVIQNTGDSIVAYKVTVGTVTATSISSLSGSKARLICRNSGNYEIYIGSHVNITSQGVSTFELGAATSTYHVYDTYSTGQVFAIGLSHPAGVAAVTRPVYCIEER